MKTEKQKKSFKLANCGKLIMGLGGILELIKLFAQMVEDLHLSFISNSSILNYLHSHKTALPTVNEKQKPVFGVISRRSLQNPHSVGISYRISNLFFVKLSWIAMPLLTTCMCEQVI